MGRLARFVIPALMAVMMITFPGCGHKALYSLEGPSGAKLDSQVATGQAVPIQVRRQAEAAFGCAVDEFESVADDKWKIEPSEGAQMKDGAFVASEPGTYTVTPIVDKDGGDAVESFTFVVTDEGEISAEVTTTVGGPEEEEPGEPEEPSTTSTSQMPSLAGDWSWTGAQETDGVLGPSSRAYTYTFKEEAGGWAVYVKDTRLGPVSFDGTNVSFTVGVLGTATFTGVLKDNTITGTQIHDGGKWEGSWEATRVP